MKKSFTPAQGGTRQTLAKKNNVTLFLFSMFLTGFLFAGCEKEEIDIVDKYTNVSPQTNWELRQAKAASEKYRNFNNAMTDGYVDINVIVPEMGYHYLKASEVDAKFDYRKPEILVYNKKADGSMELVAVEYAIPLNLSAEAPEGFTGNEDVWDHNTTFGLWLLHAWVWAYNPNGVFNPTNPSVHVH